VVDVGERGTAGGVLAVDPAPGTARTGATGLQQLADSVVGVTHATLPGLTASVGIQDAVVGCRSADVVELSWAATVTTHGFVRSTTALGAGLA
jgi:Mrp family chromosome partitioning ATPase